MSSHVAFNNLDYIVLGIILVSGVLALMRGFVREALSLASWMGAFYVASKFYPLALPFVHKSIKSEPAATMGSATMVFVVVLIIFSIISFLISRMIRGEALTAIDRSLGFIFGVLRGALFVCIIYLVAQTVIWPSLETTEAGADIKYDTKSHPVEDVEKKNSPPQWIPNAKTFTGMRYGAKILKSFLPEKDLSKLNKQFGDEKINAQKVIDDKALELMSTPTAQGTIPTVPQQPGYNDATRDNLNNKVNQ